MKERTENEYSKQAIMFCIVGLILGIAFSIFAKPDINFIFLVSPLFMAAGFGVISFIQLYNLGKEKIENRPSPKEFEWGVEINLRKLQINYDKSSSMMQFAGLLAAGSFVSMAFIAKEFSSWNLGHQIFFPLSTLLFVLFLHLAFRWWVIIRSGARYLRFQKENKSEHI